MSASQQHGLEIERLLKAEFERHSRAVMPSHLPMGSAHTARFDMPGYMDPYGRGIPTSIKTAKCRHNNALIYMADALRIVDLANFDTTRLLVTLYEQRGEKKYFSEVREYLITGSEWEQLTGGVPPELLVEYSKAIKTGSVKEARAQARQWKLRMKELFPDAPIRWNAKIGSSDGQRRLQCSLHLRDIELAIEDKARIRVFGAPVDPPGMVRPLHLQPLSRHLWGHGLRFPLVMSSPPRQRRQRLPEAPVEPVSAPRLRGPKMR